MLLVHDDHISRRKLSSAASFELSVDRDVAVLNRELGLSAAPDDTDSLEELIERDRPLIWGCHGLVFQELGVTDWTGSVCGLTRAGYLTQRPIRFPSRSSRLWKISHAER